MRSLVVVALVLASLSASLAHADVVENPPESCPAGSTPRTAHTGPFCAPTEACVAGGVCPGGGGCTTIRQCIETRGCGGLAPPDSAPCTLEHVTGLCGSDGSCSSGGVCREHSVCPGPGTSSSGCGCRVTTASSPSTCSMLFLLGVVVALVHRVERLRSRASRVRG